MQFPDMRVFRVIRNQTYFLNPTKRNTHLSLSLTISKFHKQPNIQLSRQFKPFGCRFIHTISHRSQCEASVIGPDEPSGTAKPRRWSIYYSPSDHEVVKLATDFTANEEKEVKEEEVKEDTEEKEIAREEIIEENEETDSEEEEEEETADEKEETEESEEIEQKECKTRIPQGGSINQDLSRGGGIFVNRKKTKGKSKRYFVCCDCGNSYSQWWGRCPACKMQGTVKAISVNDDVDDDNIIGFEGSEKAVKRSWLPEHAVQDGPMRLTDVNGGIKQSEWRIKL